MPSSDEMVSSVPKAGRLMVDAPVRMFHLLFAACLFGAWWTSESEKWCDLHVTIGYGMVGLLLFRVVYGLFGPAQARLRLLFGRLKGLTGMLRLARMGEWEKLLAAFQNVPMAAVILAVLALTAEASASGYLAWNDAPEWVAELHEESGEALIALAIAHIVLVLGFSLLRRRNLARTMLTGKIPGSGVSLVQHNRAWLALALFVAFCAFGAYKWQQTSERVPADRVSVRTLEQDGKVAAGKEKRERFFQTRSMNAGGSETDARQAFMPGAVNG